PRLSAGSGQPAPFTLKESIPKYDGRPLILRGSPWKFSQHGESGLPVSELLPNIAKHADQLCVIRSMHTLGRAHGDAMLRLHTGSSNFVRPSMGSWICYGLGTENENLPAFIT